MPEDSVRDESVEITLRAYKAFLQLYNEGCKNRGYPTSRLDKQAYHELATAGMLAIDDDTVNVRREFRSYVASENFGMVLMTPFPDSDEANAPFEKLGTGFNIPLGTDKFFDMPFENNQESRMNNFLNLEYYSMASIAGSDHKESR
jgi:hypothetical protein